MRSNGLQQFCCQCQANLLKTTKKDASRRLFIAGMAAGVATTIAVGTTQQNEPASAVTPPEARETPIGQPWWPCHHELITKQGIFIQEVMNFTSLLADKVYEFVFILTPLFIKGATGLITRPIAIA